MDPRVTKLDTVEKCENFAVNAKAKGRPDLEVQALQRAIQIRANTHGAVSDVEKECLEAIYAYEKVLSAENGRLTKASRTWPMVKRLGIIPAVEKVVTKREVSSGFTALAQMGLQDYAFEAVILRHPHEFSAKAVEVSTTRMRNNSSSDTTGK